MKRLIIFMTITLVILSCSESNDSPDKYEDLCVSVYDTDTKEPIKGVLLTLVRVEDNKKFSGTTSENGKWCFLELKSGDYSLSLKEENYETKENQLVSQITNRKDEYSFSLKKMPASLNLEPTILSDTINFGESSNVEQFRFINNHEVPISWKIYYSCDWIKSVQSHSNGLDNGTLAKGKTETVSVIIDRTQMIETGPYQNTISVGTSEVGGAKVVVKAYKVGEVPDKATIAGASENICPSKSVQLTASAKGAVSYKWFNGSAVINGINGNSCEVSQSGTYYVTGINTKGDGLKSDGFNVSISNCPELPAQATVSGNSTNNCQTEGENVTLTASSQGATSYKWYKGNTLLGAFGNTYVASESGTYYVRGVNISGESAQLSNGKVVNIQSCVPAAPANVTIDAREYSKTVYINWDDVLSATGYKVQICNNLSMSDCENNFRNVSYSSITLSYQNDFFCGQTYFRIFAINDFGKSTGTPVSCIIQPAIDAWNTFYVTYNHATHKYILSYINASVAWYSGVIYYEIQRKTGSNGTWEVVDTITGNTEDGITLGLSYQDAYSSDETVYYRVRAYINAGCGVISDYSNIKSY